MLPEKWPQWIIIPTGFLLVAAIIGTGFGLVTAAQSASPSAEAAASNRSSYEASMSNPDLLAWAHAEEGLECLDCHTWQAERLNADAVASGSGSQRATETGFCLDCHVDNEHASYEQVMERTRDFIMSAAFLADEGAPAEEVIAGTAELIIEDRNINPHDPHPDTTEVEEIGCWRCHKIHRESPLVDGCYAGCHHYHIFTNCTSSGCHGE
jgi:hypothetical protein